MRFSHTLMLWILGCLSALFALSALALFGIDMYAKSHSYQATIHALDPASIAPPPPKRLLVSFLMRLLALKHSTPTA